MTSQRVYAFIDTDVFIRSLLGNYGDKILEILVINLDENKLTLIFPDIIKSEVLHLFTKEKRKTIERVTSNLEIRKVLGIQEPTTDEKKKNRSQNSIVPTRDVSNSEKLDEVTKADRDNLLLKIENYYECIFKKLEDIFQHKNSKNIDVTNEIMLRGMKRSLMKLPPFSDKTTEQSRTKDADCIAFEALIDLVNSDFIPVSEKLVMCLSDKDYIDQDGKIHEHIKIDLAKISSTVYRSEVVDFLESDLGAEISNKTKIELPSATPEPSLASSEDQLDTKVASSNLN